MGDLVLVSAVSSNIRRGQIGHVRLPEAYVRLPEAYL
jgi:hypothetical protein